MKTGPLYLLAVMALASCGRGNDSIPVPRPAAYHRIALPDSIYRVREAGPVSLQINRAATDTVSAAENTWVTAVYPDNIATVYITVVPLSAPTAAGVIDNRIERMSLNTGGQPTEVTSFVTPAEFDARIIVTPAGTPTPVQFIITDNRNVLVSGSATVRNAATAPADSIAPIVEMLERDFIHLAKTLIVR